MSSRPLIAKYPLDKSGTSLTNKVVGEIREINGSRERAFVPYAGPFYADTMSIINADTGEPLVPVDDYVLCQPFQQASLRTGLDVECVVWLKTETPIRVQLAYQVVGGEYSWSIDALVQMINEIDLDGRPVQWGAIIGKPTAYPPAPHIHDIGDTYGWEYVTFQLEGIRNAILVGDEASHDELRQQMKAIKDELQAEIDAIDGRLTGHVNDFNNPHRTTKAQVGLGSVEDFPIASAAEALAGTAANRYMTPQRTSALAQRLVDEAVTAHINDKNNPHNTTKAQVGLGNVQNYGVASTAEANAGVVSDKYMTPALTKGAIMTMVGDAFNAHVANLNNPHNTTKAQVGLGLVDNFPTATTAEATAGTATNRFMTPALTRALIKGDVGDSLAAHVANQNNPHNTTKAQVGLSLVENYAVATTAEAQAGIVTNKYMTPQLVAAAIAQQAGSGIGAHIADKSNPHGVTKAQVGLSAIPNSVTRSRGFNSDAALLTAGGMYDHVNSGDHDARYVMKNAVNVDGSIHISAGRGYVWISGGWRQFWPAQWQ